MEKEKRTLDNLIEDFRKTDEGDRLFVEDEAEVELSEHMAELRRRAQLTQTALAQRLGKTQAHIAKLEAGGYDRCGIGTLKTIARALGVDLSIKTMFVPQMPYYGGSILAPSVTLTSAGLTAFKDNVIDMEHRRARKLSVG